MSGRVVVALFLLAIANFVTFLVAAAALGGDAFNGRVENGHYFLASHGRLTEVGPGVFTYSLWHVRSLFITHPLAILGALVLSLKRRS